MNHFAKSFSLSACALAVTLLVSACGGGASTDTVAPTMAITDDVSAATATGVVNFTFTFSEDVGTSFVVEDIVVTGGTAGTLTKVDATHYTLAVTPTASAAGTITVNVAAAKYSDLAFNANVAASTASQDFNTVTATVLASFDEATPLAFVGFDGGEGSSIAAGPAGGSALAGKILRTGGQVWAGAKVTVGAINLTTTNHTISARVYSPTAGTPIVLKLEGSAIATAEVQATETVVMGWQTLTWVIPTANIGPVYTDVVMLPNLGTLASVSPGETYYFDNITLGAVTAPTPPAAPVDTVLASFDEFTPLAFVGFDGGEGSSIAAGPTGGSALAGKILRTGGQVWAGAKVTVGAINLTTSNHTISAHVYSPTAGTPIVLKLEGSAVATAEVQATEAVVMGWQTLTWVIPTANIGPVYTDVVMLPNLGTLASVSPGETYYFDDIKLVGGGAAPVVTGCTATSPAVLPNLVTFDGDCGSLLGFQGTGIADVVLDPAGGSNKVGRMVKPAGSVAAFYAGATVSTGANYSITTIPFVSAHPTVSVRVYSAYPGTRVHLKLENAANPGINVEHDAFTTLTNQWETLTYDLSVTTTHFIPSGATTYDSTKPTAGYTSGAVYNKANIFFDYGLGSIASGAYAVMPAERTYYFDDLKFVP